MMPPISDPDDTTIERRHPEQGQARRQRHPRRVLAALYASAESGDLPLYCYIGGTNGYILPVPNMNIMNGGAHDFATTFRVHISPYGFDTYHEALRAGVGVPP